MMDQEPPGAAEPPESAAGNADPPVEPNQLQPPPPPVVAWDIGATTQRRIAGTVAPPFTVRALISDAFARYAADPVRLFVVNIIPTVFGLVGGFAIGLGSGLGTGPGPIDFTSFGSYMVSTALFTLVAAALGLVTLSINFAILEAGPGGSLGRAARLGITRVGWLLATGILVLLAVAGVYLASGIAAALLGLVLFRFIGPLAFLPIVAVLVLVLWVWDAALPRAGSASSWTVPGHGRFASRAVTRRTAVWLTPGGAHTCWSACLSPRSASLPARWSSRRRSRSLSSA